MSFTSLSLVIHEIVTLPSDQRYTLFNLKRLIRYRMSLAPTREAVSSNLGIVRQFSLHGATRALLISRLLHLLVGLTI